MTAKALSHAFSPLDSVAHLIGSTYIFPLELLFCSSFSDPGSCNFRGQDGAEAIRQAGGEASAFGRKILNSSFLKIC